MIILILKLLSTHIITSPLTSLCLFCNSCFELLILATEPVSNSQGLLRALVRYTSITCISDIHYCWSVQTRQSNQRSFDETACDALITNDDVIKPQKKIQNVCDGGHIKHLYIKYTLFSLCHPSYPPNIQGSSASSDHFLCSVSTQFQALVQLWASSWE